MEIRDTETVDLTTGKPNEKDDNTVEMHFISLIEVERLLKNECN